MNVLHANVALPCSTQRLGVCPLRVCSLRAPRRTASVVPRVGMRVQAAAAAAATEIVIEVGESTPDMPQSHASELKTVATHTAEVQATGVPLVDELMQVRVPGHLVKDNGCYQQSADPPHPALPLQLTAREGLVQAAKLVAIAAVGAFVASVLLKAIDERVSASQQRRRSPLLLWPGSSQALSACCTPAEGLGSFGKRATLSFLWPLLPAHPPPRPPLRRAALVRQLQRVQGRALLHLPPRRGPPPLLRPRLLHHRRLRPHPGRG